MKKDTVIIILLITLIGTTTLLTAAIVTDKPVKVTQKTVKEETTLSCPQPNITVTDQFKNIKNPDMNPVFKLQGETLKIGGIDSYGEITGRSMNPSIQDGDILFFTEYTGQDLEQGIVIRFNNSNGAATAHRITGNYQDLGYVVTSGDNLDSEEYVELNDITHIAKGEIYHHR